MKNHLNRKNLSVSSHSSNSSASSVASSTSLLSPGLSPRKSLLSPSDYLLSSPPLSPALPSLIPRHGKKPQQSRRSRLRRLLLVLGSAAILGWVGFHILFPSSASGYRGGDYEIVGSDELPEEPTAIMLTDKKGKKKWTVSIPGHHDFPLLPSQYHEICNQVEHIRHDLQPSLKKRHGEYYERDPYFVDVADAQKQGLLPDINKEGKIGMKESQDDPIAGRRPCGKSLTYVMETSDAGMGTTLMGLWMSYGLAQKEGRAFFVDDTRWPYGKFTDYFLPPRHPNCMPPPETQRLPCPHSARHLIVSAATFPFTFGEAFQWQFLDRKRSDTVKRRPMYDLLRAGYEELFHLADEGDAEYVIQRTEKTFAEVREKGGTNVGLHIRRGDVHPWDYQYAKDYLPLTHYMDEVRQILIDKYEHDEEQDEEDELDEDGSISFHDAKSPTSPGLAAEPSTSPKQKAKSKSKKKRSSKLNGTGLLPRHGSPGMMASQLFLGSDDPDVYNAPEVSRALRAQDRIVLASKSILEAASGQKKNPWVDEIHGWEGGFYRDQFFSLGHSDSDRLKYLGKWKAGPGVLAVERDNPANIDFGKVGGVMLEDENPDFNDPPSEGAMSMRRLVGRAYLLDLAVLGQSDAVVCAVSASGCRLLAVMMGWEKAFEEKKWRNVDGQFPWAGLAVKK